MRLFRRSSHRALTAAVLLGIILIVTHVVVPTAKAESRVFSKGRVQPDLISHVYKHMHKQQHAKTDLSDTRNKKKHNGSHKAHAHGKKKRGCGPVASDFVCPSKNSNEPAEYPITYTLTPQHVAVAAAEIIVHYANQPPPRLPQNDKVTLLL
jgi:hypothetical protein